jgi:hypothetical protein
MVEAAETLQGADPDTLMERIATFDRRLQPVIAETARAMDDKW